MLDGGAKRGDEALCVLDGYDGIGGRGRRLALEAIDLVTSETYATEHIAEALRSAREAKGLTQRALSALTGVPQAHISKIEANTVDLRLSSLLALAHALGLELALVPRKAVPAVQSLTRTAAGTSFAIQQISKDLARAGQALARIQQAFDTDEFKRLRERLAETPTSSPSIPR